MGGRGPLSSFAQSWDRDPYLFTDPDTGAPTTVKKFDEISRNFIVANYNSLGAVDNVRGCGGLGACVPLRCGCGSSPPATSALSLSLSHALPHARAAGRRLVLLLHP